MPFFSVSSIIIYMFYRLFYRNHLKYSTIFDPDRTTNCWSLKLLTWANVILLSVYCTKTAIDIFTLSFYRFIFLHCLSCVCQLCIKDHDDDDDVLISLLSALPSPVNGFDDRSYISQNLLRVAPPNECVYRYRLKSFKNYLNSLLVKYIHFPSKFNIYSYLKIIEI